MRSHLEGIKLDYHNLFYSSYLILTPPLTIISSEEWNEVSNKNGYLDEGEDLRW